ncbi:MAG: RsbRD N-terminal domain-containing protein [bacterium]
MEIINYLQENRNALIAKWQQAIIDTYPEGAGKFLSVNKNQFGNPIGFTLNQELPKIYDELTGKMDNAILNLSIESIIKLRAVQDFSPSEAVGFINLLKNIVVDETQAMMTKKSFIDSYFTFEKNIEIANGIAFEKYLEMKLKLSEIKINEVRKRNQRMVDRLSEKYSLEF